MAIMGRWGSQTFEVSTNKVNPFAGFSTSAEKKAEDSKSKKSKTELEKVSFTITCNSAAGVDPEEEFYAWRSLIDTANYLYIHGQKWWSNPLILQSVGLGSVKMDDFGRFRSAEISLSFEEKNQKQEKRTSRATASKADKCSRKK